MKWVIASDIHGSAYYCSCLLERYKEEGADRLLLLGDLLYHGPRNDLPREYDPKQVIRLLNACALDILCVRGNCDSEVDQMVLDFPILAEYALLDGGDRLIFATHGHRYHEKSLPPLHKGDILLHGHTHIPACTEHETFTYLNPGSVSLPKESSEHGYMVYEKGTFLWKNLTGKILKEYSMSVSDNPIRRRDDNARNDPCKAQGN